ncbi:unnamed protein product [Musa acuminata subsp. burmannicoides]
MPTVAALLPRASVFSRPRPPPPPISIQRGRRVHVPLQIATFGPSRPGLLAIVACSAAPFDEFDSKVGFKKQSSKKSTLLNLIQEIEPLDMSLIQKDVPANTVDAMKRTISGMLGLLPSNQFHVQVEALWESLFKLFVSSMKTGYTLHNAEYRLCLEKNLDFSEEHTEKGETSLENDSHEILIDNFSTMSNSFGEDIVGNNDMHEDNPLHEDVGCGGEMTPEAKEYIQNLQSRLNSVEKELNDIKRKSSALQMQQFVGEEKNDLLDYLRSLQPEKVAELSEPTFPGVEETIHSVVHGLLATLSPKMHSKPPPHSNNVTGGTLNVGMDDCAGLIENTSIQFQPLISVPRDYLARLLFWCMLLGHYLRGLEYRLDLVQLFEDSAKAQQTISQDGDIIV